MKKKHFLFTLIVVVLTVFTANVFGQTKADTSKYEKIFINQFYYPQFKN